MQIGNISRPICQLIASAYSLAPEVSRMRKAREKPKQPDSYGPDDPNPFSDDDSMDDVPFATRARCAFPSLAF